MFRPNHVRVLAAPLLLCLLCIGSGCNSWLIVDHRSSEAVEKAHLVGKKVRISTVASTEEVRVSRVSYPFLDGALPKKGGEKRSITRSFNLRRIELLEVWGQGSPSGWGLFFFPWPLFIL